ncbi:hypothetical protein [Microbacterium sp. Clip185]|uniref:hypothetical protein n=1 Tax=Microbacterium sp. Clip185 TaxID=3025663 RepID=UPI0023658EA2|nr:hypothetical protein [Microbacterium sp. Clip185]WDG16999.1 hypothetical protein PQV94_10140 [Microbacterium sp. Clip185]
MPTWWEELLHITTGRVGRHADLPDLRHLPSRPVALERTHYIVNDRERHGDERRAYVLRRAKRSRRDKGGISVTSNGRGVGYLPAAAAHEVGPLIDRLGGAVVVNGAGARDGGIRLWVDLPEIDNLRQFVDSAERTDPAASTTL